jgi:uncharacterized protein (TIGR02246 family)
MTRRIAAGLAVLALAAPLPAFAQAMDLRTEIAKVSEAWQAAYNAGDAAALAALYAEDATILPPGGDAVSGRAAIQAHFAEELAQGAKSTLTLREVIGHGDMAIEIGGWSAETPDGTHLDHGKYMTVYRKVGGAWLLTRDMWNSSMTP